MRHDVLHVQCLYFTLTSDSCHCVSFRDCYYLNTLTGVLAETTELQFGLTFGGMSNPLLVDLGTDKFKVRYVFLSNLYIVYLIRKTQIPSKSGVVVLWHYYFKVFAVRYSVVIRLIHNIIRVILVW